MLIWREMTTVIPQEDSIPLEKKKNVFAFIAKMKRK